VYNKNEVDNMVDVMIEEEKKFPTLDELLEDWDGVPPEKYDWGKPFGREIIL
jgi:hypothetical protein